MTDCLFIDSESIAISEHQITGLSHFSGQLLLVFQEIIQPNPTIQATSEGTQADGIMRKGLICEC